MTIRFGAIADDLTGATDLAGLLARSGARVSLRMGVPTDDPSEAAAIEVVALKIRMAPLDDARSEAGAALAWLRQGGAQRFYWKYCSTFDSTPKGNIGPVAEHLMDLLGTTQTIYCPAFPENGRAVFMGHLFVGRDLLSESPMKDHPLTPMRDSSLLRLLAPQVTGQVGLVDRLTIAQGVEATRAALADLAVQGVAHVVMDGVANEDLRIITEACLDMPLITGGSALAMPIPTQVLGADALAQQPPMEETAPWAVVLSGSCSAMTNQQVAAYRAAGRPTFQLDPLALAEDGTQAAQDWLAAQDLGQAPLIYATAAPDRVRVAQERLGVTTAGHLVENALGILATQARDMGARRFVVAGGETAGAVSQALGVTRLDIGAEIAPGVPWCFATSAGQRVALALKSGNFGTETFFTDALAALEDA